MGKRVKNILTTAVFAAAVLAFIGTALATSVREYQAMTLDEKTRFLVKETYDLLAKVKAYDPKIEQKTRHYMLEETNEIGGSMGLGGVVDVINLSATKRPETMDALQVENITKIIMRNYWKRKGIMVPTSVLGLPPEPTNGSASKP